MPIQPYINFDGDCLDAVRFYVDVFKTEQPEIMYYEDMPEDPNFPITDDIKKLVLHTTLNINGSSVMFSDVPPDMPFLKGNNVSLTFISNDEDEIRHIFDRLKEGGTVGMELGKTFWSKCYGAVTDKFGVEWQLDFDEK